MMDKWKMYVEKDQKMESQHLSLAKSQACPHACLYLFDLFLLYDDYRVDVPMTLVFNVEAL